VEGEVTKNIYTLFFLQEKMLREREKTEEQAGEEEQPVEISAENNRQSKSAPVKSSKKGSRRSSVKGKKSVLASKNKEKFKT